ncbi:MAG: hypothetical protein ACPGQS_05640, partial [Bradymonadia bacterium]
MNTVRLISLPMSIFFSTMAVMGCSEESTPEGPSGGNRVIIDAMVAEADARPDSEIVNDCEEGASRPCRLNELGGSVPCEDAMNCVVG